MHYYAALTRAQQKAVPGLIFALPGGLQLEVFIDRDVF